MRLIIMAFLLACCSGPEPAPREIVKFVEVAKPRACPPTPEAIPPPPKPRTFEAAIAWGNATEEVRKRTADALDKCRGTR